MQTQENEHCNNGKKFSTMKISNYYDITRENIIECNFSIRSTK